MIALAFATVATAANLHSESPVILAAVPTVDLSSGVSLMVTIDFPSLVRVRVKGVFLRQLNNFPLFA